MATRSAQSICHIIAGSYFDAVKLANDEDSEQDDEDKQPKIQEKGEFELELLRRPKRQDWWIQTLERLDVTKNVMDFSEAEEMAEAILIETYECCGLRVRRLMSWRRLTENYMEISMRKYVCLKNELSMALMIEDVKRIAELKEQVPQRMWGWWVGYGGKLKDKYLLRYGCLVPTGRINPFSKIGSVHHEILTLLDPKSLQFADKWGLMQRLYPPGRLKQSRRLQISGEARSLLREPKSLYLYELIRDTFAQKREFAVGKIMEALDGTDLSEGADPNWDPKTTAWYGWHMLHFVCASAHAKTCEEVLEIFNLHQANWHIIDNDGNTLLHIAAMTNNIKAVQFLLRKTPIPIEFGNSDGFSAFLLALDFSHMNAALEILECSMAPQAFTALEGSIEHRNKIIEKENANRKLLKCVTEGLPSSVKELLLHEHYPADIEACDVSGRRAIHLALIYGSDEHLVDMMHMLIEHKCDINSRIPEDSKDENASLTPLHLAAKRRHKAAIKVLLDNCANSTVDKFRRTPLMLLTLDKEKTPVEIMHFYLNGGKTLRKKKQVKWKHIDEVLDWRGKEYDRQLVLAAEREEKKRADEEFRIKSMTAEERWLEENRDKNDNDNDNPSETGTDPGKELVPPLRAGDRDSLVTQYHLFDVVANRAQRLLEMGFEDQDLWVEPNAGYKKKVINDYDLLQLFRYLDPSAKKARERRQKMWTYLVYPMIQMSQRAVLEVRLFDFLDYLLIMYGGEVGLCTGVFFGHTLETAPWLYTWDDIEEAIRNPKRPEEVTNATVEETSAALLQYRCNTLMDMSFRRSHYPRKLRWVGSTWAKYEYPRDHNSVPWDHIEHAPHERMKRLIPKTGDEAMRGAYVGIERACREGLDRMQLINLLHYDEAQMEHTYVANRILIIRDLLLLPLIYSLAKNFSNNKEFVRFLEFTSYITKSMGPKKTFEEKYWVSLKSQIIEKVLAYVIRLKLHLAAVGTFDQTAVTFSATSVIMCGMRKKEEIERNDASATRKAGKKKMKRSLDRRHAILQGRPCTQNDFLDTAAFTRRLSLYAYIELRKVKGVNSVKELRDVLVQLPSPSRGFHFWRSIFLDFMLGVSAKAREILSAEFSHRFGSAWHGLREQPSRRQLCHSIVGTTSGGGDSLSPEAQEAYDLWAAETDFFKKLQRLDILCSMVAEHVEAVGRSSNLVVGRLGFDTELDLLTVFDKLKRPELYGYKNNIIMTEYDNGFHKDNTVHTLPSITKKITCTLLVQGAPMIDYFKALMPMGICHLVTVELTLNSFINCEKLYKLVGLISEPDPIQMQPIGSYPSVAPHSVVPPEKREVETSTRPSTSQSQEEDEQFRRTDMPSYPGSSRPSTLCPQSTPDDHVSWHAVAIQRIAGNRYLGKPVDLRALDEGCKGYLGNVDDVFRTPLSRSGNGMGTSKPGYTPPEKVGLFSGIGTPLRLGTPDGRLGTPVVNDRRAGLRTNFPHLMPNSGHGQKRMNGNSMGIGSTPLRLWTPEVGRPVGRPIGMHSPMRLGTPDTDTKRMVGSMETIPILPY